MNDRENTNKMKFAIRDDDVSYFTRPEDIDRLYSDHWKDFPISVSVIPFVYPQKAFVKGNIEKRFYPIGENKELVSFLKEKIAENRLYLTQHGYSHMDLGRKYEFERGRDLPDKISRGKAYLEETFGQKIEVFVPPHNSILSHEALNAMEKNGLNLLLSYSRFPKSFSWRRKQDIIPALKILAYMCKNGPGKLYPYPMRTGGHFQTYCYGITSRTTYARIRSGFEFAKSRENSVFCLAIHHNTRDAQNFEMLYGFLNEIRHDRNLQAVTAAGLFERAL